MELNSQWWLSSAQSLYKNINHKFKSLTLSSIIKVSSSNQFKNLCIEFVFLQRTIYRQFNLSGWKGVIIERALFSSMYLHKNFPWGVVSIRITIIVSRWIYFRLFLILYRSRKVRGIIEVSKRRCFKINSKS